MITSAIARLERYIGIVPEKINSLSEIDMSFKPSADKWSKKEILGHLIDSAANDHHRFIRARIEPPPFHILPYNADLWVKLSDYQSKSSANTLAIWLSYNQHLLNIILSITEREFDIQCHLATKETVSLAFLINDYVDHMEHHLQQIVSEM